jgi:hypothetical protein
MGHLKETTMANHSDASRKRLLSEAMARDIQPEALKAACRNQFGCGIAQLTDAQVGEFIATFSALAHTGALHAATGLGVTGPGGIYKPDASPAPAGKKCKRCGRPGMWISGAGMVLCHAHQDSY